MRIACILLTLYSLTAGLPAPAQVSPYYLMTTVAGIGAAPYPGDGQKATAFPLFEPNRIAFDPTGYLYVSDSHYRRVFEVDVVKSLVYLMAGSGETGLTIDGIDAAERRLYGPRGLAFDSNGILYIGDGAKIRKVITAMTPGAVPFTIHTVAGTGESGYSGDGGPATTARINTPSAIAIDAAGNVYFSDDFNCVIRRIAPNGIITTVAGTGEAGYSGDGGPGRLARLDGPSGLAVALDGTLYIVDTNNHAVRRLRADGTITTLAGNGVAGYAGDGGLATSARLYNPYGVAVDADGNVLIADTTNRRIRKVARDGTISTLAQLDCKDIAVSPGGYIAVVNHLTQNVRRVHLESGGGTTNLIGNIRSTAVGDGGPATSAVLGSPQGVAVDAGGNMYIADWAENRVRRVSADGVITTYAGTGEAGDGGDGGPATSATLVQPMSVAADSSGNVYVSCNTKIRWIHPNGIITTYVGTREVGYNDNPDPARTMINFPYGMTTDTAGNLYIADTFNNRVRRVTPAGTISTIAGTGIAGYSGNGGPATSARIAYPTGVAVDSSGNIYVADQGNFRIRKISSSGIITAFAGTGEEGNTGDGGPATDARLSYLYGVALDDRGNVFVTSGLYIRKISPSGVITTVAGNGDAWHNGDGDLATTLGMDPYALTSDRSGRVYIVDSTNRRVRRIEPAQIFPAGVLNGASYQGGKVAPGEIVTVYGFDIGPASLIKGDFVDGLLSNNVDNVQILFDGTPASLIYISSGQSSAIVPYSVAGKQTTVMQVVNRSKRTNTITLSVADAAPGLFAADGSGRGPGAILNQDYTLNSADNAAARGSVLMIYATGEGQTNPAGVDGKVTGDTLPKPVLPVSVTIGGVECKVLYAGAAPGIVAGLMQVNVTVPENAPQGGAIPVRLKVGDRNSQDNVTVAIK